MFFSVYATSLIKIKTTWKPTTATTADTANGLSSETSISINSEVEKMTEKKKQKLGRITKDEDREVGSVKINVYLNYLKLTGGYIVFGGVFIGKFIDN